MAATGFHPGWGINLNVPVSCVVRDCVTFMNVARILGFIILWNLPNVLRNLAVYLVLAAVILGLMPSQARYEKLTEPDH